ncbi:MAG: phosphoribosylformylglycinamidine synthase subunit PurS [Bryobacterales bacterium]|jgi:phosphoribosylformylglycinamidine synthase|nr:phosphoribosylformylglycinamidine synthase subunit PurS [Bryobacterales bacterium]
MQARVYVSLKPSVLDPQGKTICSALNELGHRSIADVRQGKVFEITLDDSVGLEEAQALLQSIAHEVLANPVIEEYRVELQPANQK